MKFIIIFTLSTFGIVFAKESVDFNKFNKEMMKDITNVLHDNPELYETKPINRKPASVEEIHKKKNETTEKLDRFSEQADGVKSW